MFRNISLGVVYILLALGANPMLAQGSDGVMRFGDVLTGDMRAMVIHDTPAPISQHAFLLQDETQATLADFQGQYILLNFWATWCAPCRHEMPALDELQTRLGGDDFRVVTLATGRNPPQAIRRFFQEQSIENLTQYRDINQQIARDMGVFGLPITVLINPEGYEIARLRGDADWASDDAIAFISAVLGRS
jgi:thiol-disulfide isomerase/thioredoxin